MQSRIKHLLKHFALVLKAKLNQLKPFVRFVFHPSTLLPSPTYRIIKGLHIQTLFILLYASFSCPYPFPQKFSELIRIPSDNIFGITQEHQLFSRIINHLFMKKETEFEPALRQVISQTFIDTPAPRKTRYRIIHPDLNTLKNAEDNLSIVLCVSERKTRLELATPTLARLCSTN